MKLFSSIFSLLKETYNCILEFNIALHGAAIAFYAIFSTAPLIIIFVWIVSIILGAQMGQSEFKEVVESIVGTEITQSIVQVVKSTSKGATGFWSSLIAVITILFGATTLLSQVKETLNKIWGLSDPSTGTIWHFFRDRLVGLLFIATTSLLFFVGLISESMLYGFEHLLIPLVGSEEIVLVQIGNSLTNILLAFMFFAVMFKVLPDIEVRWRNIAIGAIVTTILVLSGKSIVDWYLSSATLQPAYKAAGSFVVFLIWIYYNVQVVLIGAIFTKVFTDHHGGKVRPYWDGN